MQVLSAVNSPVDLFPATGGGDLTAYSAVNSPLDLLQDRAWGLDGIDRRQPLRRRVGASAPAAQSASGSVVLPGAGRSDFGGFDSFGAAGIPSATCPAGTSFVATAIDPSIESASMWTPARIVAW